MAAQNPAGRRWCFTINNPTVEQGDALARLAWNKHDDVRYIIYQFELSESGTPHVQGYVELNTNKRRKAVQSIVEDGVGRKNGHYERSAGTREQARDYCRKDDTRMTIGTPVASLRFDSLREAQTLTDLRPQRKCGTTFPLSWRPASLRPGRTTAGSGPPEVKVVVTTSRTSLTPCKKASAAEPSTR